MFLISLFLLFAAPNAPLTASEKAFLTRIDKAVSRMSDQKTAFIQFEKSVTKADAIRCNQMQSRVAPNTNYYADCAFAQAWRGIDYDLNIHRLLRPYRFMKKSEAAQEKDYPFSSQLGPLIDPDNFYVALNWLYLKHHDLKSLGAWEDLTLDGAPGEGNDDELSALWDNHAEDMLRAAFNHPLRIKHLAGILVWGYEEADDKDHAKQEIADAKRYTRSKDKRVASAAQALVKELRTGKY